MSVDLLIFAMKKAVEADKRTIKYVKGILNNWSKKGIKTLIEAQKEDEEYKNNKDKANNNFVREETLEEKIERYKKEWGESNDS